MAGRNLFAQEQFVQKGRNLFADQPAQQQPENIDAGQVQTVNETPQIDQKPQPGEPGWLIANLPEIGGEQALGTIVSGMAAEPIAGIAGLASAPFVGVDKAVSNMEAVRNALTLIPDTPEGQAKLNQISDILQPVGEAITAVEEGIGDPVFEATGSPAAGAIAQTVPTAALNLVGAGAVKRASQIGKALKAPLSKQLNNVLNKGDVLTTDVFPPKTFIGKAAQKVTERIPVVGTGGKRAAQQKTRVESLDNIAKEFDIDPSSTFEADIVKSANRVFKRSQSRASELRTQAVTELNKVGDVSPKNSIKTIDNEIAKITALGERGDQNLINTLNGIKGELSGNFERMKNIRTTIFDDIKEIGVGKSPIKSGGDAVLTKVSGSLSKDLDDFAINAGKQQGATRELRQASSKWKASNRIFKDNFSKAKDTELKRALSKGNIQPEVMNLTIKGGKQSELKRLFGNLDLKGRAAAQKQILKNALEKADGNPTIFLNELNRVNNRRATDVFFRGRDKATLNGYKKFIDMTRRAQTESASIASQAEVSTVGLVGGAAIAPKPVIASAVTIGALGRAFESSKVRNLLIKLSNMNPASKKAKILANSIGLMISDAAQTSKKEIQEKQ